MTYCTELLAVTRDQLKGLWWDQGRNFRLESSKRYHRCLLTRVRAEGLCISRFEPFLVCMAPVLCWLFFVSRTALKASLEKSLAKAGAILIYLPVSTPHVQSRNLSFCRGRFRNAQVLFCCTNEAHAVYWILVIMRDLKGLWRDQGRIFRPESSKRRHRCLISLIGCEMKGTMCRKCAMCFTTKKKNNKNKK